MDGDSAHGVQFSPCVFGQADSQCLVCSGGARGNEQGVEWLPGRGVFRCQKIQIPECDRGGGILGGEEFAEKPLAAEGGVRKFLLNGRMVLEVGLHFGVHQQGVSSSGQGDWSGTGPQWRLSPGFLDDRLENENGNGEGHKEGAVGGAQQPGTHQGE